MSKHNVPDDLWPDIPSLLPAKSLVRFRCVSRSWRSIIDDPDVARFHLLSEILSRIPVESLLRLRCVSSSWRSLIDDPGFARLHLIRFNKNSLLVTQKVNPESWNRNWKKEECAVRCGNTLGTTANLDFSMPAREGRWAVNCTIDGLFMLKNNFHQITPELMLWNPSIRKTLILPLPTGNCAASKPHCDFGIGFDPLIKDYKFVRFLFREGVVSLTAIYTLGANSWKTIDFSGEGCFRWQQFSSYVYYFPYHGPRTFCVGGILYGLARVEDSDNLQLVSFDLSSEIFASTQLPEFVDFTSCKALAMVDDGCSLAVVMLSEWKGSIWALESLGADLIKSPSLTKRYTFAMRIPECEQLSKWVQFLSLEKNGEMLLMCSGCVISYNLETHEERIILKKYLYNTWPYMESLIRL